jgi:glycosyltransferase involved in cell wall biosynthesis
MISVVVPALNEEPVIGRTLAELRDACATSGLAGAEIIVVDDGSTDRTGAIAAEAGARLVRHPHNVGYGRSVKDGVGAATHDTIVIIDADGTYPLEALPQMLAEFHRGVDMVVGARTGDQYRDKAPLRAILKWLVEFTAGRRVPDVNSGLRVFSKSTLQPYQDHLSDTFSFTTSLTLAYMMTGRFVSYVPIGYRERVGRTKVRLLRDSLRTLQYIVQAILYYNPLKLFLLICGVQFVLGVVLLLVARLGEFATAFALGVGCLVTVVPVFCLGLLAELLSRIMVKPR